MKRLIAAAVAALVFTGPLAAQDITSEVIRRAPVPGSETMEVIVSLLTVPVGATIPLHTHPGMSMRW